MRDGDVSGWQKPRLRALQKAQHVPRPFKKGGRLTGKRASVVGMWLPLASVVGLRQAMHHE